MEENTIYIKQYDTMHIICEYLDEFNLPISLVGVLVTADMATVSGTVLERLHTVVANPINGQFIITSNVAKHYEGNFKIDILFENTETARIVSSEIFNLLIGKSITKPRGYL